MLARARPAAYCLQASGLLITFAKLKFASALELKPQLMMASTRNKVESFMYDSALMRGHKVIMRLARKEVTVLSKKSHDDEEREFRFHPSRVHKL